MIGEPNARNAFVVACAAILLSAWGHAAIGAPSVAVNAYPSTVQQYGKFEVALSVTTVASNPFWPYDPAPDANVDPHPNAVPAGAGVSVDGLFLPPGEANWNNAVVQPGFYYQDYTDRDASGAQHAYSGRTWLVPVGYPTWRVRFAPTSIGTWRFKIRVTDAGGTAESAEASFGCTQGSSHGFIKRSDHDPRYFSLSDGTDIPLVGIGNPAQTVEDFEVIYPKLADMGTNLLRCWWQSSMPMQMIYGAGGQGGDLIWNNLNYSTDSVRPGHLTSCKLTENGNSKGLWATAMVKPSTDYRLTIWVKTAGFTGAGDWGLYLDAFPFGTSAKLQGDADWTQKSYDFTIDANTYAVIWLAVKLAGVTGGAAYISDVSLKERLPGGGLRPETLQRPDLQSHTSFHLETAWVLDRQLEIAVANGIYIKPIIGEKADSFLSRIQADGTWGVAADSNTYASATHANRTYQQYYWRYIIARYGWATSLHSVEFVNEGDPFNGNHTDAVKALGAYFRDYDPQKRVASTSNWHSFPPDMWRDDGIGFADVHMYMGWAPAAGGYRIWPGWDGIWTVPNNNLTPGNGVAFDTTVAHSGRASLKFTIPGGWDPNVPITAPAMCFNGSFQAGTYPGHTVKISAWVKAQNLANPIASYLLKPGLSVYFCKSGGDWISSPGNLLVHQEATYEWMQISKTYTVPPDGNLLGISARAYRSCGVGDAYLWWDDVVVEDLTTGLILNYNGGFEYRESESDDPVAGHCAYSRLTRGIVGNKPIIRGETAFTNLQKFSDPYKGSAYHGQDQAIMDDTEGIWWRKWAWAQLDAGGLYEIYWFAEPLLTRKFTHSKAYQAFMSGIPLSNGNYQDVSATVSNIDMRVLGQKDLTSNRAHLWIDNSPYTWKAVVDHNYSPEPWSSSATYAKDSTCGGGSPTHIYKSLQASNKNHAITDTAWWQDMGAFSAGNNPPLPPPVSGTVTVPGLKDGAYEVQWWDTSTGAVTKTEYIDCAAGSLVLSVANLQSDIACKIRPRPASIAIRVLASLANAVPGQMVTVTVEYTNTGETNASNVAVTTRVPVGMKYVDGSADPGGTYDAVKGEVSWVIDSAPAHGVGTKSFRATVE